MAIRALQVGQTFTHVSKFDVRPKEGEPGHDTYKPTKWKWKVLDSRVLGLLKDKTTKIGIDPSKPEEEITTHVSQNQFNFDVCSLALEEPEDFYLDAECTRKVKWQTGKRNIGGKSYDIVTNETMGLIPDIVIAELAEIIMTGQQPTVEEGNGSGSQFSQPTSYQSETV
jgi:hypothetical protein